MSRSAVDAAGLTTADVGRIRSALGALEPGDFERIAPPSGLWERIVVDLVPQFRPSTIEYCIDADDTVVEVGADWAVSARDGAAVDLADRGTGRSLWASMDADAADLWRVLVARVRTEQVELVVPIRCDTADARRWFDVTLTPESAGRIRFRSTLSFEEERAAVELLAPDAERDVDRVPVRVCSWCNDGEHGDHWVPVEELVAATRLLEQRPLPPVSYGICPSCRDAMTVELLSPARRADR